MGPPVLDWLVRSNYKMQPLQATPSAKCMFSCASGFPTLQGVTKVGDYQYVENEGMPVYNTAGKMGNLFVYYFIEFPKTLSEAQKKAVRELFPAA